MDPTQALLDLLEAYAEQQRRGANSRTRAVVYERLEALLDWAARGGVNPNIEEVLRRYRERHPEAQPAGD